MVYARLINRIMTTEDYKIKEHPKGTFTILVKCEMPPETTGFLWWKKTTTPSIKHVIANMFGYQMSFGRFSMASQAFAPCRTFKSIEEAAQQIYDWVHIPIMYKYNGEECNKQDRLQ